MKLAPFRAEKDLVVAVKRGKRKDLKGKNCNTHKSMVHFPPARFSVVLLNKDRGTVLLETSSLDADLL